MAKKATKKKEENILNLESILFNCRDYLRGSASLNEKRDVILTLVFLRFIGEKFDDTQAEMRQQCIDRGITDEEKIARFLDSPSRYKNIVYVPEAARWSMLINVPTSDLVAALDDALQAIEDGGDALKGCVKLGLFTAVKIQPNELKKVVDEVNKISHKVFGEEKDLIGRVYEYFLKSFAVNATKEDGEFYTPHDIVELIAAFIEPFDGTLYDPCCGSGGMFIQCAKYVEAKQGDITAVNVFGQEKDDATFRLAKMNLAMRGISHHLGDGPISTFDKDWHAGLAFDYIMANPPFNLKHWFTKDVTQQGVNWADYGTPPESNANYAWILHILSKLKADKGIAGFLLANGALGDDDTVAIRQKLIENDKVEAIVVLPRELFYTTDISVTLWILNANKKARVVYRNEEEIHYRDREKEILFIDMRQMGKPFEKKYVRFTDENIRKVADTYHNWQREGHTETYTDMPEFCKSVSMDEEGGIADKGFSLVPSKYIEFVNRDESVDYDTRMKELQSELADILRQEAESREVVLNVFKSLGYEIKL